MSRSVTYSSSPMEMIKSVVKSRDLIIQMTKRDVVGRYRGSMFGLAWSFFNPLLMLTVYTLVFSTVFKARWAAGSDSKTEFALALFIGMIIHGVLAESLNRSPGLILSNVSYVKKVVFPLEILPWIQMGTTLFHVIISLGVWVSFYLFLNHTLNWTVIFLPLILMPLIIFSLGLSLFLASLGVYIRDIGQVTGLIATVFLFLSPIFYPASRLPEPYQTLIYINPLTFVIEQARDVLMWGKLPDWFGLIIYFIASLFIAWAGFIWFQKTRKGFADVL